MVLGQPSSDELVIIHHIQDALVAVLGADVEHLVNVVLRAAEDAF